MLVGVGSSPLASLVPRTHHRIHCGLLTVERSTDSSMVVVMNAFMSFPGNPAGRIAFVAFLGAGNFQFDFLRSHSGGWVGYARLIRGQVSGHPWNANM